MWCTCYYVCKVSRRIRSPVDGSGHLSTDLVRRRVHLIRRRTLQMNFAVSWGACISFWWSPPCGARVITSARFVDGSDHPSTDSYVNVASIETWTKQCRICRWAVWLKSYSTFKIRRRVQWSSIPGSVEFFFASPTARNTTCTTLGGTCHDFRQQVQFKNRL